MIIYLFIINMIIVIIYLFIWYKYLSVHKEYFENRCLFVLYGEAFREGKQNSRIKDTNESYENQMLASDSHLKFIDMLKTKHNIDTDVSISTYETKYESDLKKKYKNMIKYNSEKELIGENNISQNGMKDIDLNNYKFIIITRNDIFFKDEFINNFKEYDKITYVSQILMIHDCYLDGNPRVNHIIIQVPNKYFNVIKDINVGHESWKTLNNLHGYNKTQLGFMLESYHDADSNKEWNPYYKMIGREETTDYMSEDKPNIFLKSNDCYLKLH